jgi:hypothetical protein
VAFEPADPFDFRAHVAGLRFQLLNADDVGTLPRKPCAEAFARRRPDAVEVQRYNSQH